MASIRKRGEYQWQARVIRKGMKALAKTFVTRQEAENWASLIEAQVLSHDYVDTRHLSQYTLADLLDDMLKTSIPPKKGALQEINFVGRLKQHPLAKLRLSDIGHGDIRKYRDERLELVSTTTVAKEMAMLSSYYNYAISEFDKYNGLTNPVTVVRRPTPRKGRTRRYEEGEIEWLLKHTESPLLADVIEIALDTSMRRSEIVANILIENIDLNYRTIHLEDTKNGSSRTVAFSSKVKPIFERRIGGRKSGKLFLEEPNAVTRAFCRARDRGRKAYIAQCEKDGVVPNPKLLVDLRFHDARHEATSRFFEVHGLSDMEAAGQTGHTDLKMLKGYTHIAARHLAAKLG